MVASLAIGKEDERHAARGPEGSDGERLRRAAQRVPMASSTRAGRGSDGEQRAGRDGRGSDGERRAGLEGSDGEERAGRDGRGSDGERRAGGRVPMASGEANRRSGKEKRERRAVRPVRLCYCSEV